MIYTETAKCHKASRLGVPSAEPALTKPAIGVLIMAKTELPTVEYLRQILAYDPITGVFTHRHAEFLGPTRNARFANKPAFVRKHRLGYRTAVISGRTVYAHRAAWAMHHGAWPDGEIDHINHDKADNRIANLRAVSKLENGRNMPKLRNNTSGHTGVYWHKASEKWVAKIRVDGRLLHLGSFVSKEAALAAREAAKVKYGFHANHGVETGSAR